jgi:hypothetical protein
MRDLNHSPLITTNETDSWQRTNALIVSMNSRHGRLTGFGMPTLWRSATTISQHPSELSGCKHTPAPAIVILLLTIRQHSQAGYCFSGTVPASGGYPNLNFNYCAKNPGVPYPVFIAVTNQICLAEFEGIVAYEDNTWTCPGFDLGLHPGQIYGGDNYNDGLDSSNWQIYAS